MKKLATISFLAIFIGLNCFQLNAQDKTTEFRIDFFGDLLSIHGDKSLEIKYDSILSTEKITAFYDEFEKSNYAPVLTRLLDYKTSHNQDDWLFLPIGSPDSPVV